MSERDEAHKIETKQEHRRDPTAANQQEHGEDKPREDANYPQKRASTGEHKQPTSREGTMQQTTHKPSSSTQQLATLKAAMLE